MEETNCVLENEEETVNSTTTEEEEQVEEEEEEEEESEDGQEAIEPMDQVKFGRAKYVVNSLMFCVFFRNRKVKMRVTLLFS